MFNFDAGLFAVAVYALEPVFDAGQVFHVLTALDKVFAFERLAVFLGSDPGYETSDPGPKSSDFIALTILFLISSKSLFNVFIFSSHRNYKIHGLFAI